MALTSSMFLLAAATIQASSVGFARAQESDMEMQGRTCSCGLPWARLPHVNLEIADKCIVLCDQGEQESLHTMLAV